MNSLRPTSGFPEGLQPSAQAQPTAPPTVHSMHGIHPSQVFFNLDIRRALQMHKALAIGIFALVLFAISGYVYKTWSNYSAESLVSVQMGQQHVIETGPSGNRWPLDGNSYEAYMQQQVHNVTRPDVLAGAVKRMPNWKFSDESDQQAAARLDRKTTITRVGGGYQISIKTRAKSADLAAQMANAIAASFIDSARREMRAGDQERIELLREERERIEKELAADRAEQEDLNKKLGIAAVSGIIPDPVDEQLSALRTELVRARAENDQAAARLTAGGTTNSAALEAAADEIAMSDAGIVSMKTALNSRRSILISQMANLTPNHPQYKQDADELAQINANIENMSKEVRAKAAARIQQKLKGDLERTSQVEARLNAQLAQMAAAAGTATPRMQRFNDLTTDIQRLQTRFTTVEEQYRNLTLENNAPGSVYLSQAAPPPLGADHDKVIRNVGIMLVMGLVFAFGGALTAHNLDQRIFIAGDVERVLGFPPMAQLPDLYEVGTGVSEEYMLRLAAAVEHAYQQDSLKSCIFTGVTPGAGATTICKRVTSMLEAMGRQTVQVDASGTPATAPAPEGVSDASRELVPTRTSRSSALLQQMAEETGEESIVLTDTAPLLVSGETEYLARFVDSAIVVIESGVTTRRQLRDVANTLQRLDVRSAGFVLNRISLGTANPAFRESVRAVERHVDAQTRSLTRENGKKRREPAAEQPDQSELKSTEDERLIEPKKAAEPEFKPTEQPTGVTQEIPAAKAPTVPEPPARVASNNPLPEQPSVLQTPRKRVATSGAQLPRGREASRGDEPRVAPVSIPQSNPAPKPKLEVPAVAKTDSMPVPAPLAEPVPEPVVPRIPFKPRVDPPLWPASRASEPGIPFNPVSAAPGPAEMPVPKVQPNVAPVSAAIPVIPPAEPATTRMQSPFVSGQAPVNPPSSAPPVTPAGVPSSGQDPAAADVDDLPYSAASRLGGLRNLLVTLGLKTLNQEGQQPEAAVEERPAQRPVYAEPYRPAIAHVDQPTPQAVIAQPEFLPPRVAAEPAEREKDPAPQARPVKPSSNRWGDDDIETLPSWRGQYRKRR